MLGEPIVQVRFRHMVALGDELLRRAIRHQAFDFGTEGVQFTALWEWLCKRTVIQVADACLQQLTRSKSKLAQPFPKSR